MDKVQKALTDNHLALHSMIVFRRAERTIHHHECEIFKEHGLTPTQFGVLDILYSKGSLSVGKIIEKMLSTSGNMTVVIRNMEKEGYVQRTPDPEDKRSYLISLTDKGIEKIEEVLPEHAANVHNIFRVLTEEEQEELIRMLRKFKNL